MNKNNDLENPILDDETNPEQERNFSQNFGSETIGLMDKS